MLDPQPDPDNAGVGNQQPCFCNCKTPTETRGLFLARKGGAVEASVAIQVLPQFVESTEEVVRIVDEAIAYIQSEFPDAYVGPFETTIQGEYDHCMKVVAEVNRIVVAAGAPEVATYVKIFFAPEKGVLTTEEKITKYHLDEN